MRKYFFLLIVLVLCVNACAFNKSKIDYVISRYEQVVEGKKCLFYPVNNPKKMVVIFSSALPVKYSFWEWFWQDNEAWQDTAYLFLKDDRLGWYLGVGRDSFISTYTKIINHYMERLNLGPQQVITMGFSMGGYGALYYAVAMKLKGAVIFNPQINYASARWDYEMLEDSGLLSSTTEMFAVNIPGRQWRDLDIIIEQTDHIPFISISFGSYFRDVSAAHALIKVLKNKKTSFIMHSTEWSIHEDLVACLTKEFVDAELHYVGLFEELKETFLGSYI